MAGIRRRCPSCNELIEGIETDWVLREETIAGHEVASIGTAEQAAIQIKSAAEFQIAANLAAYDLGYDHELNLGFRGTAWLRCPEVREIGAICVPR